MSLVKHTVTWARCDSCGAEVDYYPPVGWVEFVRDGKTLHNCSVCKAHGEERLAMGDPPG